MPKGHPVSGFAAMTGRRAETQPAPENPIDTTLSFVLYGIWDFKDRKMALENDIDPMGRKRDQKIGCRAGDREP